MRANEFITEKWSQKYKSSINCSHPKGFSQKAHCAGKKKHNESMEMESVCPDCGMCQTHGNLNEIKKGQKDSNGYTKCWPGKHAEGTKKGKNGGQVRNCVPNESVEEGATKVDPNAPFDYDAWAKSGKKPRQPGKAVKQLAQQTRDAQKKKQQGVAESFLNESAYEEAWELISQPVPEIQQFVKQLGLAQDDTTAKQIAPMIDATPDTQLPAASIPKLKNLANKGNDVQTLKAIQQISGRPDAAQQYAKIMQARDAGEGRQRGYDVSGLINSVKSGNYEAPVLLKLATGTYVIGGRTRLYAALALGIPAKVKIISVSTFAKQGQQGVAEDAELAKEFDLIESIIESLAERNGVDAEEIWEDLESLTDDELYAFAVTTTVTEDWQKVNKKDKTDGMSKKAVSAYRREHPGSKLKTAVTTKPSKLKKDGKASKRRKSFCARSNGQKKMHHIDCSKTPDKAICKARRRWNCE